MNQLKKRLEKAWFTLLLTTIILIGVSRVFRVEKADRHPGILIMTTEVSKTSPQNDNYSDSLEHIDSKSTKSSVYFGTKSTKSLGQERADENLIKNDENVLFFNRVPKCGSEMLVLLMQWMQGNNGFRHVRLAGGNVRRLPRVKQRQLVEDVMLEVEKSLRSNLPTSFDRHVYFTNFTEFSKTSPVFMNIVRDPVDKAVSRFYYGRVTPNPLNPDIKFARSTSTTRPPRTANLDKCLELEDKECTFYSGQPYDLAIPYFCGHYRQCMILNDRWALARAKQNIEEFYPVVGVLEMLNETLSVLEHKLPKFFTGVSQIYYNELLEPHKNKNRKRPRDIDEKTRQVLEEQLSAEYDLYEWIKARLKHQAQDLST